MSAEQLIDEVREIVENSGYHDRIQALKHLFKIYDAESKKKELLQVLSIDG